MEITKKLDKEFPMYSYTIYTTSTRFTVHKSTIPLLQDEHAATMLLILLF